MDDLEEAGAHLVAISPQLPEHSRKMKEKHDLSFPVLSDEGNEVAKRFRVVFTQQQELQEAHEEIGAPLPKFNGDDSWTLPMPSRFVIRPDGVIAHAEVHPDYKKRPEPAETLEQVRNL